MQIGIDFGTTNSAVAVVGADGASRIVPLRPGEPTQRTVIHADPDGNIRFGNAAIEAYLAADLQGRFLRSLKAFLPDDVPNTTLGTRRFEFVDLVGAYLRFLVDAAEKALGEPVDRIVVGRPVWFHRDPERHERALGQLRSAIERALLPPYRFQLEPIAAAYTWEGRVAEDRTVLVGDFGGGTADFAVLRIGPSRRKAARRGDDVLGTSGVALAGDAMDGRFLTGFLLDAFGQDAPYVDTAGAARRWSPDILREIPKLYDLHRHRDWRLAHDLAAMERRVDDKAVVRRLRKLVFDDLGYPMAWAIERSKRELAFAPAATFVFDEFYVPALNLRREVTRAAFAEACASILEQYQAAIHEVVAEAGVGFSGIDEVFLTGGTSQLPFVRELFVDLFGAGKLRSADAFTSVCEGLALD